MRADDAGRAWPFDTEPVHGARAEYMALEFQRQQIVQRQRTLTAEIQAHRLAIIVRKPQSKLGPPTTSEVPPLSTSESTTYVVEFKHLFVWRDWSGQPEAGFLTVEEASENADVCLKHLGLPIRIVRVDRTTTTRRTPL